MWLDPPYVKSARWAAASGQDETGHCAKMFRSRPPDAQLPIREHHEAAREGIETFFLKGRTNAAH
jgi:hypothetical protein